MSLAEAIDGFQQRRRQLVKRYGKRLIRRVNAFLVDQSRVGDRPTFERELFPWVREFEDKWQTIRAELDGILRYRDALPHLYEVTPENARISADNNWKSFVLYGFGYRSENNCRLCPETARLLTKVPGIETAFFSILSPGAHIPAHRGLVKGLLRCHLGLIVPQQGPSCRIYIDGTPHTWQEGKALLFDDTHTHEVHNDTNEDRVVLLFDFERPMSLRGRFAHRTMLALVRRSAYVQDSVKQYLDWEEAFKARFLSEDDTDD